MKKMLLIFVVLTFCLAVPAQKKPTDREIEGLKGAVKTVFEDYMLTYVSSGPSEVNKRVKVKEYYFDKIGSLTEIIYPSYNFKYIYSIIDGFKTFKNLPIKEDNNPKDTVMVTGGGEEKPLEKNEKLVPPDDRFTLKYVYEYDTNGKITTERHYGNNGKLWRLTNYKYDDKGRVNEKISEDTVAITKYTHKYDEKGNLIETLEDRDVKVGVDSKSKTIFSEYKIDAQGNWTERKSNHRSEMRDEIYSTTTIYYRTIAYDKS